MVIKAPKILGHILLLSVYVPFFLVQLFFNVGSFVDASTYTHTTYSTGKAQSNNWRKELSSSNEKKGGPSKIRLNKRFHPESMPSLTFSLGEPLQAYIPTIKIDRPQEYLLISSILADSLRGPPVVA